MLRDFFTAFRIGNQREFIKENADLADKGNTYNSLIVQILKINDNRLKAVTHEGKGQKVFMAAVFMLHPSKAVV
jgi:hypothetical protein